MTVYERLKRAEEVLSEASSMAESPYMKAMWLAKAQELKKKIGEMTVEEAEKETN
ncbi:MAG: hypothetical protein GX031_04590 [Candidatus Riflebacteria bacterium]|nr:hypothetical protein [Candidatus Riflebacteria bacterium]